MKKYYCLVVIGNNLEGIEQTMTTAIHGTFTHKNFGKMFVSTFESKFSIWEIEEILHRDKRSYFLTKMDGHNFTATVQDINIQNDLFLDYINKITNQNNEHLSQFEVPKAIDIDKIEEFIKNNQDFLNFNKKSNFEPNFINFSKKNRQKKKEEKTIPPTLDEILDKITLVGYGKLTKFEKQCLENYSKNQ